MLKNYFKTAWRSVKKNRGFFALNFFGLYISVVACTVIALLLLHETSFDKQQSGDINIYRVVGATTNGNGKDFTGVTQYPLANAMRVAMPDEKLISQIHFEHEDVVSLGDRKFKETNVVFADSVFPKLFTLSLKEGSLKRALAERGFVVLTQSTATRYFGKQNAVGKRIKLANYLDLEVAAVIADAPANTHLRYNLLVSYPSLDKHVLGGFTLDQWGLTDAGFVYIGLSATNKVAYTEKMLADISAKYVRKEDAGYTEKYTLQPIQDVHYNQLYANSNPSYTVNYSYLYLMAAIGLFLILAACINYTNLSTALAIKKAKEVGVRKTMGATRGHLIKQFLSETFLLTALVVFAAALSVSSFLPVLNSFLDKNIPLNWLNLNSILFLVSLWAAVSLLSGLYPAFVLSGFNPIAALKSKITAPKTAVLNLRRGLVVFQFLTAQILIIGAIVVAKQMAYVQSKPLGFNKESVIDIGLSDNKPEKLQLLHDQLAAIPGIRSVSISLGGPISDNRVNTDFNLKEKYAADKISVAVKAVDKGYLDTYGLQLAAGRWFDASDESKVAPKVPDSLKSYAFVLNETASKALGFKTPQDALGKYVTFGMNNTTAQVIGVMKDYHVASLHQPVSPVLMVNFPFFYYNAGIRLSGNNTAKILASVEKVFNSIYPNDLFEPHFLDEHIASLYKDEQRTQQLFNLFTFLSIVINVLGLVGLLSFMIEQKTKEIGIRKVLGASVGDISIILSKDFVRLIIIAFVIAAPIAWFIMSSWLQGFAYRTAISWWVFAVTVAGALVITCIAVGFQTIKAALANPVKSLKTE